MNDAGASTKVEEAKGIKKHTVAVGSEGKARSEFGKVEDSELNTFHYAIGKNDGEANIRLALDMNARQLNSDDPVIRNIEADLEKVRKDLREAEYALDEVDEGTKEESTLNKRVKRLEDKEAKLKETLKRRVDELGEATNEKKLEKPSRGLNM